jgi:hypothetical protein
MANLFSLTCPPCNPSTQRVADYQAEPTYDILYASKGVSAQPLTFLNSAYWLEEFRADPQLSKSLHLFHQVAQTAAEVERVKQAVPEATEELHTKGDRRSSSNSSTMSCCDGFLSAFDILSEHNNASVTPEPFYTYPHEMDTEQLHTKKRRKPSHSKMNTAKSQ